MKDLIIYAPLFSPPSEPLAVRALTMMHNIKYSSAILVEIEKEFKDIYYQFIKKHGGLDFVEQIIEPQELVVGIRIDLSRRIWPTIIVPKITFPDVNQLLARVEALH